MHNGSVETLSEIIDRYAEGGSEHVNQSAFIRPFTLTAEQKNDLIAFLYSLTDETLLLNGDLYE